MLKNNTNVWVCCFADVRYTKNEAYNVVDQGETCPSSGEDNSDDKEEKKMDYEDVDNYNYNYNYMYI